LKGLAVNKTVIDYLAKRRGTQPIPVIEDVGEPVIRPLSETGREDGLETADLLLGEDVGDNETPTPKDRAEVGLLSYGPMAITPEERVRNAEALLSPRVPLPPSEQPEEGAGGGMSDYLHQLEAAQRQDALAAGIGRANLAQQRLAEVLSRGAYRAAPLGGVPSAVEELAQKRAAVLEHLRQPRGQGRAR
jgi:hypothetical protein